MAKYRIRKSFGPWSSSTVVEVLKAPWLKGDKHTKGDCYVLHEPTRKAFDIPAEYLVPVRDRELRENAG